MGYKGKSVQGEIPESGAIFMSNIETHKECLERKLFGLPSGMSKFVLHVKEGMTLFLFEFERRLLYGVFRATCDGEINIEPKAFRLSGKHFPAQVRFTTISDCSPLAENEFKDAIKGNYFSGKKFHFGLNKKQVSKLVKLFHSKRISKNHPERNVWRYDDKSSERNARAGDLRKAIRHRMQFESFDSRDDEVKEVDDNMYINKHIIESRHNDKREDFLTHYKTESDEFGDCGRHGILGNPREKDIEDGYMPVFSKPCGNHLDEGSGEFVMDDNKDIIDYKRLLDEYNVREGVRRSMNQHTSTTHVLSHFNQNAYSDIHLSSSSFDEGSSFIPIADNLFYPSPERIPVSKSLAYNSHDEGSNRFLDDPGSHSSIFPNFISRHLSSDAGLRMHEMDPTDNGFRSCEIYENKHSLRMHELDPMDVDFRSCEKYESKRSFGATDKRVSVFSRLNLAKRHEEQAIETDEKVDLNSSVDKVMKMLEKVVSSPKKRSGKSISVIKQDNSPHNKIEDYKFPDVNLEADADVAYGDVEGSVFQETRLVDFKRRNRRIDKENFECSADVGPVANDQLTDLPCKRRKLIRPVFVEKNFIPDSDSAHENTRFAKDSANVVLESSEKVNAFTKSMVPTCHENTTDSDVAHESTLDIADVVLENPEKVHASTVPTCPPDSERANENTLSANDNADVVLGSSEEVHAFTEFMVPSCHENTLSAKDSADVVLESLDEVHAFTKSTCHVNAPDNSNLTEVGTESLTKVDASVKPFDLNMLATCDESSSSKDDNNSTKVVQKSGNEDGNAESRLVSDVFVEGTTPKDDHNMCGWIEW